MWETLVRYYGIDWFALVINAAAIYQLGKKQKSGWILGIVANLAWIAFGFLAHSVATIAACGLFTFLNVKGWLDWQKTSCFTSESTKSTEVKSCGRN